MGRGRESRIKAYEVTAFHPSAAVTACTRLRACAALLLNNRMLVASPYSLLK